MTTMTGKDIEKHEEIKQKAWEIVRDTCTYRWWKKAWYRPTNKQAWKLAEDFYNFAKQKQEKSND